MFDGRVFHYLAVVGKKTISECVGRVFEETGRYVCVSNGYCV